MGVHGVGGSSGANWPPQDYNQLIGEMIKGLKIEMGKLKGGLTSSSREDEEALALQLAALEIGGGDDGAWNVKEFVQGLEKISGQKCHLTSAQQKGVDELDNALNQLKTNLLSGQYSQAVDTINNSVDPILENVDKLFS
jgi:hypothetical protein